MISEVLKMDNRERAIYFRKELPKVKESLMAFKAAKLKREKERKYASEVSEEESLDADEDGEEDDNIVLAGYIDNATGTVISLIVGVGVAILVLIFVGVIGGQTYQTAEANIQAINNTEIKTQITSAVTSGFKALGLTGQYLPIVVLAVIIGVVLMVIFMVLRPSGGGYYGGVL